MNLLVKCLPIVGLFAIASLCVLALGNSKPVGAQTAPKICRAAMILDRSGSIDNNELERMRQQIRRLFEPTSGIYDEKIHLGFWMFSNVTSTFLNLNPNYNLPFHTYVPSKGTPPGSFSAALNDMSAPRGNTNYRQGFAYEGTTRNPALNDMINAADILVFMTDGQPNAGGFNGLNHVESGRWGAAQHQAGGRSVIGGYIGGNNNDRRLLNYVVSGDYNNSADTFTISGGFGDLAAKLKVEIPEKCNELSPPTPCTIVGLEYLKADDPLCVPPPPKCTIAGLEHLLASDPACVPPPVQPPYSLVPSVESDSDTGGVASQGSIELKYKVTNGSLENDSPVTSWSITRVVVSPNKSAENLKNWAEAKPDYSCAKLRNDAQWDECVPNFKAGSRTFSRGPVATELAGDEVGDASRIRVDDNWAVGTKVCYILVVIKPTELNSPTNLYSKPVCLTIGKRPSVQIIGGDVSVGRKFASDPDDLPSVASTIQTSLTVKSKIDGSSKIYGSWAEYGAFAPGVISGLATAAGLEGGYDSGLATVSSAQSYWSELTFANKDGYGSFTSPGIIGDGPSALLAANTVVEPIQSSVGEKTFDGAVASGIYQKLGGDLTLHGGQLAPGSSVILHVPDGTVTIDGNLTYFPGPYTDIKDIPRLVIIAKRINIQANVENIDAWLVARNKPGTTSGFDGTINTCSNAPADLTIHVCNLRLQINGPVMARHLLLRRTAGSGTNEDSKNPAEVINLRADVYMSSLARGSDAIIPTTTYSVELPPRF